LVVTGTAGIGKSTLCARLAGTIPGVVVLDADILANDLISVVPPNQDYRRSGGTVDQVEHDVRGWINAQLHRRRDLRTDSTA
jgi:broad-specificity NMP kinase